MKNALYFVILLLAATSCKKSYNNADNGAATSLRFTPSFISTVKATETAFENGDRVGVYLTKRDLALKGSFNAKDNKLFEYFSAGDSLAGVPNSVFYPDKTTPVAVYAYYPFAANVTNALAVPFRVSSNLKSSDLCYASLPSAVPSANAQPLAFTHSLSRLSVNVDFSANDKVESITSITILGIVDSCYLNLANGVVTNGAHTADILGTTFILPPQVLHYGKLFRIECKMKGGATAEYHFEPTSSPLTLQKSKKHSITLLLSASGSISLSNNQEIKDWTEVTEKGEMTEKVNNTITLHWLQPISSHNQAKTMVLYINSKPYAIDDFRLQNGYNDSKATYTFNIKDNFSYPYTIERIEFKDDLSRTVGICDNIIGNQIYRSGDITIGYTTSTVTIAGTKWLTANLTGIAGTTTGHTLCANPQDYGMFFKWAATFVYGRYSGQEGAGFANLNYTLGSSTQPTTQSKGYDYGSPLLNGPHVGDPCKQLGEQYRTPTQSHIAALVASGKSTWQTYNGVGGYFFGPKATTCTNTVIQDGCLFFPAAGYRDAWTGSLDYQGSNGGYWSASVCNANIGWGLGFYSSGGITTENNGYRSVGLSVRCIQQ